MCRHCDRPVQKAGLCATHYNRLGSGIPMDAPLRPQRMHSFAQLNRVISYDSAHYRCKRLWGSASNYPCVGCGEKSREWAYDGTDPTELVGLSDGRDHKGGVPMRYSLWPEFYKPMCRPCHAEFDHPGTVVSTNPDW